MAWDEASGLVEAPGIVLVRRRRTTRRSGGRAGRLRLHGDERGVRLAAAWRQSKPLRRQASPPQHPTGLGIGDRSDLPAGGSGILASRTRVAAPTLAEASGDPSPHRW